MTIASYEWKLMVVLDGNWMEINCADSFLHIAPEKHKVLDTAALLHLTSNTPGNNEQGHFRGNLPLVCR